MGNTVVTPEIAAKAGLTAAQVASINAHGGLTPSAMAAINKAHGTAIPTGAIGRTPITTANGSPVAQGYELFAAQLDFVLRSEQLRQNAQDQQINFVKYMTELGRVSPTRAAELATKLGIPGLEPDLQFANAFSNSASTGVFGGSVGTQKINLPFAFNGKELSFFEQNKNVASVVADIGDYFGRPDILSNSLASLIPGGSNLFKL